jgi:hypothetical protein
MAAIDITEASISKDIANAKEDIIVNFQFEVMERKEEIIVNCYLLLARGDGA